MRAGGHRSLIFSPPPEAPQEPAPTKRLYQEPEEEILLLGQMMRDTSTTLELLQKIPFSPDEYRGYLRVILGAAERTKRRAMRLIGDKEDS